MRFPVAGGNFRQKSDFSEVYPQQGNGSGLKCPAYAEHGSVSTQNKSGVHIVCQSFLKGGESGKLRIGRRGRIDDSGRNPPFLQPIGYFACFTHGVRVVGLYHDKEGTGYKFHG